MAGKLVVIGQKHPVPQVREVYFIRGKATGLIKIGVSDNTRFRLKTLQTNSPDELELVGVLVCNRKGALEQELHSRFASSRRHGEWFAETAELASVMKTAVWPEPRARLSRKAADELLVDAELEAFRKAKGYD